MAVSAFYGLKWASCCFAYLVETPLSDFYPPTINMISTHIEQLSNRIGAMADLLLHSRLPLEARCGVVFALTLLRRMDSGNCFPQIARQPDQLVRNLLDLIGAQAASMQDVLAPLFSSFLGADWGTSDYWANRDYRDNRDYYLYSLVQGFASIDLHPDRVDSQTMGAVFDNLMQREMDVLGQSVPHVTPVDVAHLVVQLLMEPDRKALSQTQVSGSLTISICDPACGYGQMLVQAQNWLAACNGHAVPVLFGAEKDRRAWAFTSAACYMRGQASKEVAWRITCADIFSHPPFPGQVFDYLLTHPPHNVDWVKTIPSWEYNLPLFRQNGLAPSARYGVLAFLLYLVEKFAPYKAGDATCRGTRAAIILNAGPLSAGAAGAGESEIRRWLIEHDLLEAVVALPAGGFNNKSAGTFICVLSNRKSEARKGKIQLIDARDHAKLARRSGGRTQEVSARMQQSVNHDYASLTDSATSRVLSNLDFGYRRLMLARPLRLRFQITQLTKTTFLNTCPELFDAIIALEAFFGTVPHDDWNEVWRDIQRLVKLHGGWRTGKYGAGQRKLMRKVFTTTNPLAKPVLARPVGINDEYDEYVKNMSALFQGQAMSLDILQRQLNEICGLLEIDGKWFACEADPHLKDAVDIPLTQSVLSYFMQEIRPFVPDAWIDTTFVDAKDGGVGKVGYQIDFQKYFPQQQEIKSLLQIEAELADAKSRLFSFLQGESL